MLCLYMAGSVMNEHAWKAKMQKTIHLTSSREPSGMVPATKLGTEQVYPNISCAKSVLSFQRISQSSCEKSVLQPGQAGEAEWPPLACRQLHTVGQAPHLTPHLQSLCPHSPWRWLLGITYGRSTDGSCTPSRICTMLSNPSQQWECTDLEKAQLRVVFSSLRFTSQSDH